METIAKIKSDFTTKFGIPRQSGICEDVVSTVVFEEKYRDSNALKGLEEFSHIWLIWEFSHSPAGDGWSPTVRPPRLGGNERKGVFATRSPNRPNPIGLSCVKIHSIERTKTQGTVINVLGADLMDGTPIYDIKPYIPLSDCKPEALQGFSAVNSDYTLKVDCEDSVLSPVPEQKRKGLIESLSQDPRPQYQSDENRVYAMEYAGCEVKFTVKNRVLKVTEICKIHQG